MIPNEFFSFFFPKKKKKKKTHALESINHPKELKSTPHRSSVVRSW